jgi:hypothetical protein
MSDETYDPLGLNINLKEVDTSRPVLVEGKFLFSVKECSVVPKKDDPSKRNLMVVFALDQEADSVQGDKINPGFQVRRYLPLQQSDNPNAQDFTKDLVRFLDAAFDIDDPQDRPTAFPDPAEFVGRQLGLAIRIQEDDTGKQNDVRAFLRTNEL